MEESDSSIRARRGRWLTCQIAIVSRHIREVERHLKIYKLLCGELGAVQVTRCDELERVEVVHLRIQVLKNDR